MVSSRARVVLLGAAAVLLVIHSLAYNFVTDDAFISFVYSRNLAEHGELSFNLGHAVEGYTSFSWTALMGLGMLVGIPPEIASRVLGTLCALGTLYVVFRAMERALDQSCAPPSGGAAHPGEAGACRPSPWAAVPALLLACSSGFACWTSGGLETQLFTLLCAVAIDALVAAERDPVAMRRAGIALALAAMTRPEGVLVAAVLGAVRLVRVRGRITRSDLVAAACFVGIWAPWFAWRWHYYGYPFPNTYYVKASGPWARPEMAAQMRSNGLYYIWSWARQTRVLYALPLVGLGFIARPRSPRFALALACGALAVVYLVYAVSVGGDFMGLHRFIMPVFACAAVLVALGLEWACARAAAMRWIAIAAPALLVVAFAATQLALTIDSTRSCAGKPCPNDHGIDTPAYLMIYTADRAAIGKAMAGCFTADDFSILGGAGAQPYYARMRGIDVFGLVSERIAHEEPRTRARAGHTKWGRDPLLAAYDPTFVFSCYAIHATPKPPPLPCDVGFWTRRGFEELTMHVPDMQQMGTYYTFLAKADRHVTCPGLVRP